MIYGAPYRTLCGILYWSRGLTGFGGLDVKMVRMVRGLRGIRRVRGVHSRLRARARQVVFETWLGQVMV